MNSFKYVSAIVALFIVTPLSGCFTSHEDMKVSQALAMQRKYIDSSRLYKCIEEISVFEIKRGMAKAEIMKKFNPPLSFTDGGKKAVGRLTFQKPTTEPYQAGPSWEIVFIFNTSGIVEDFYLTLPEGK